MWEYTPRQIAGFMFLASKRELMQAAQQLSISANAARGKPKEIERTIKEWKQKSE